MRIDSTLAITGINLERLKFGQDSSTLKTMGLVWVIAFVVWAGVGSSFIIGSIVPLAVASTLSTLVAMYLCRGQKKEESLPDLPLLEMQEMGDIEPAKTPVELSCRSNEDILKQLFKEGSPLFMQKHEKEALETILTIASQKNISMVWDAPRLIAAFNRGKTAHPLCVLTMIILDPKSGKQFADFKSHHVDTRYFKEFSASFAWHMGRKASEDKGLLKTAFQALLDGLEMGETEKNRLLSLMDAAPMLTVKMVKEDKTDDSYKASWTELFDLTLKAAKNALQPKKELMQEVTIVAFEEVVPLKTSLPWQDHIKNELCAMQTADRWVVAKEYVGVKRIEHNNFFKNTEYTLSNTQLHSFIVRDVKEEVLKIARTLGKESALENRLVATTISLLGAESSDSLVKQWEIFWKGVLKDLKKKS